ncbi:transposase [Neochlamydia sp. S13]|uniref:transposase n=1 Tax=Neochlamydia sp. S13 TaxID=1353976 RepID=UPI0009AD9ACE|nr:transposase [Neochlamydia sp. S13]
MLTPGNVETPIPAPDLSKNIFGKMFADKSYISHQLFIKLDDKGLEIITKLSKNIKNRLMSLVGKILSRKRGIIERLNNKLKNSCQIEHHRHRSP